MFMQTILLRATLKTLRKVRLWHLHLRNFWQEFNCNASDLEMFALMSYEGDKGRTAPDSINNYFAYKTMKADAGYGMASADENSFVNEKETAFSAEA